MIELSIYPTYRVVFQPINSAHILEIVNIYQENQDLFSNLGLTPEYEAMARELVFKKALPPQGNGEQLFNYLLKLNNTGDCIGLLSYYVGYPTEKIVYIGDLYLRPHWQRLGIGKECLEQLEKQCLRQGIQEFKVAVHLGNWQGLNFWVKQGFKQITKLSGTINWEKQELGTAKIELSKFI